MPEKSVKTLLSRLNPSDDPKRFKGKTVQASGQPPPPLPPVDGWIPLKRANRALLAGGVLHFFVEDAFPRQPDCADDAEASDNSIGVGEEAQLGPWLLAVEQPCDGAHDSAAAIAAAPPLDVAAVMRGSFNYALPYTPGARYGLERTATASKQWRSKGAGKHSARNRPLSLKSVDTELVRAIPLLVASMPSAEVLPGSGGGQHVLVRCRFVTARSMRDAE